MRILAVVALALITSSNLAIKAQNATTNLANVQFVSVAKDVQLEVVDWGGTGRPLVLLAGMGNTAHIFDAFAPKLVAKFHVVGITRRGFAPSSIPDSIEANYSARRLGEDVMSVIHSLKLEKPLVAGHSIAGEELSYLGTTYPQEIAGLIYLDAGFPYAYYDESRGDLWIDANTVRHKLERLLVPDDTNEEINLIKRLQTVYLPALERDLQQRGKLLAAMPDNQLTLDAYTTGVVSAILSGLTKFSTVKCPALAIFAWPHDFSSQGVSPEQRAVMESADAENNSPIKSFEQGNPQAHVVVIAHADHYVFKSNEADVLREIDVFAASLK